MINHTFNPRYGEQPPLSGYVGAIVTVLLSFALATPVQSLLWGRLLPLSRHDAWFGMVVLVFLAMLLAEYIGRRHYLKQGWLPRDRTQYYRPLGQLFKATLYRFFALLVVFNLLFFVLITHVYFGDRAFQITRNFFGLGLGLFTFLGIPYIFLTLKYRSALRYEFNDYALHLILIAKGLVCGVCGLLLSRYPSSQNYQKRAKLILTSRRTKKTLLTYGIIFFFLTLMIRFMEVHFESFDLGLSRALQLFQTSSSWFDCYRAVYQVLYHLFYIVDVCLAIIGYGIVSRWLENRTRSVEMTWSGWLAALLCYPPMSEGFTAQFLNYGRFITAPLELPEWFQAVLMALTLILIAIYVWATISLSFKFSNLTNRGIVTTGPYAILRHPAYISKNISWWLENPAVLTSGWAIVCLLISNGVYFWRAATEERHLSKDPRYQLYCKAVRYRFIPLIY